MARHTYTRGDRAKHLASRGQRPGTSDGRRVHEPASALIAPAVARALATGSVPRSSQPRAGWKLLMYGVLLAAPVPGGLLLGASAAHADDLGAALAGATYNGVGTGATAALTQANNAAAASNAQLTL